MNQTDVEALRARHSSRRRGSASVLLQSEHLCNGILLFLSHLIYYFAFHTLRLAMMHDA